MGGASLLSGAVLVRVNELAIAVSRGEGGIEAKAWLAATASRLVDAADAPAGSLDAQRAAERIDRRAEPP